MPPCTAADQDLFQTTVANAFFASSLARTIRPVWTDVLPPFASIHAFSLSDSKPGRGGSSALETETGPVGRGPLVKGKAQGRLVVGTASTLETDPGAGEETSKGTGVVTSRSGGAFHPRTQRNGTPAPAPAPALDPAPAQAMGSGVRRLGDEGWKMVYEGVVEKDWCNYFGAMHGAAAAWVVDTCTSAALVVLSGEGFWEAPMLAGVTLSLDMTYFHPAHVAFGSVFVGACVWGHRGTKLRISVVVERLSTTLANMRCELSDWDSGKRYASGTHLKLWRGGKAKL